MFAKRYAPADWKKQAFGFDVFDVKPWLARVAAAKDDLEFFEIEAEYVAALNDVHTGFQMNSTFAASLGFTVDIYDGKVLVDSINRSLLPTRDYPFAVGDELVSVDGRSVDDWVTLISKYRRRANLSNTRRAAAGQITSRSQVVFPRAVEIGDSATVEIRRSGGEMATYSIPWNKSGYPVKQVGRLPMPHATAAATDLPEYLRFLNEIHTWKLPDGDVQAQPLPFGVPDENGEPQRYTLNYGSRAPIFRSGLPADFVVRRGLAAADFHYSGTYKANGHTIGYLRVPTFTPASNLTAVRELETEIDYFENNTDALVVDVMRNPGGGCYMLDVAAHLVPYPFYFFGEQIRPTQDRLNSYSAQLELARLLRADQWVINTYEQAVSALEQAMAEGRNLTDPVPSCTQTNSNGAPMMDGNVPTPNAYTKPMIVLIDEFSTSAADIFPSMIQDNGRAPLVGHATNGGGGSISGYQTGFYSESYSTNTNTLVVRKNPIVTAEYPTAPYVENIGARPDVPLEYMTLDNLLNSGKTFVQQFTDVLVGLIEKPKSN
jgi:Peptidase family S41/PDZ domain